MHSTLIRSLPLKPKRLLQDLFLFQDLCNVFVIRDGSEAIAIDFGSGRWRKYLPQLGIKNLRHVFLTHHHADQLTGLSGRRWPFDIHASAGERTFLDPAMLRTILSKPSGAVCPPSYAPPAKGIPSILFDMAPFGDFFWSRNRFRFVSTPGHSRSALTILANLGDQQVAFCGDAVFGNGKIWEPHHLEWHHLYPDGVEAARNGILRLADLGNDLLCPSHGSILRTRPEKILRRLAKNLASLIRARGSVCPGEPDRLVPEIAAGEGARRLLPHLYRFGVNGYLLLSKSGQALAVDTQEKEMPVLRSLLARLHIPKVSCAVSTHHHLDHADGLPALRKQGARIILHPWVAQWLRRTGTSRHPWFEVLIPRRPILADQLWPTQGTWRWNEYKFQIAPFPGQTWWHCAFQTVVDGRKVLFSGDNFQPPSRWSGQGGFCAWNSSRLVAGYGRSAALVLRWRPEILACGHGTSFYFSDKHFRKVAAWAKKAERALLNLSPHGNLEQDYFLPAKRAWKSILHSPRLK